ncbi:hypothetical protein HU200_008405 [Digitaria exilis]|uniref:Uncharacterized protein n=1 Tax=Digitaria exilis TaxID=1010633 RepID=A0A835FLU5_9POAL|nr:hypothetical protein HU200_008405 [Digitaria exilis]
MDAAVNGQRELVEILFPVTRPIPSVPDWSVDGIIRGIKHLHFEAQDAALVGEQIADAKSQGKEAFAKGEYISAIFFYSRCRYRKQTFPKTDAREQLYDPRDQFDEPKETELFPIVNAGNGEDPFNATL